MTSRRAGGPRETETETEPGSGEGEPSDAPAHPRDAPAPPREEIADEELPARVRIAITRLNRRLRQESVTGLSPPQESALSTIRRLRSPTLGELAQAEQVQPPTMTRIIGAMEAAGLVVRLGDEGDKRVSRVELTALGRATLERIKSLENAYLARQIAVLPALERARVAELAVLLERLVEER